MKDSRRSVLQGLPSEKAGTEPADPGRGTHPSQPPGAIPARLTRAGEAGEGPRGTGSLRAARPRAGDTAARTLATTPLRVSVQGFLYPHIMSGYKENMQDVVKGGSRSWERQSKHQNQGFGKWGPYPEVSGEGRRH